MANPNKVMGRVKITADGQLLETDGSSTIDLGGVSREPVVGDYQAGSFMERDNASKVDTNLLFKGSLKLADLRAMDNVTLNIAADTGQNFVIRGAYLAEVISFSSSDGKAKTVFMGPPAEEV